MRTNRLIGRTVSVLRVAVLAITSPLSSLYGPITGLSDNSRIISSTE